MKKKLLLITPENREINAFRKKQYNLKILAELLDEHTQEKEFIME